jgi:hypothetical protein
MENVRVFVALSPLAAAEGVDREVEKAIRL